MPSGTKLITFGAVALALWGLQSKSHAAVRDQLMQTCILDTFKNSSADRSVRSITAACHQKLASRTLANAPARQSITQDTENNRDTVKEEAFTLSAHRLNYVLPFSSTNKLNRDAYADVSDWQQKLRDVESKYQLSVNAPIGRDLLRTGDSFNMAFTITAWWQTYSKTISRPFRETNYRPEFFYNTPLTQTLWGFEPDISLGIEHDSNGRDVPLSRSWNRVFSELRLNKPNQELYLRPWYRLRDPNKNPKNQQGIDADIDNYFGYFEAGGTKRYRNKYELSYMFRGNPKTEKGAAELGFSFPVRGKLRGYTTVFHGYGESLIDYNHAQTRVGIGFALSEIL